MGIGSHSDPSCTDSSAINMSAAVTRSPADSLCIAFSQCRSTVEGLIPSRRAICLDCIWPATSRRHSRSRAVRRSRTPFTVVSGRSDPGRSRRSPCASPADRIRSAVFLLVPLSVTAPCPARTPVRTGASQTRAWALRQRTSARSSDQAPATSLQRSAGSSARRQVICAGSDRTRDRAGPAPLTLACSRSRAQAAYLWTEPFGAK